MPSRADPEHFDVISLGSGEAGKYICWTQGAQGKLCAIIERKWLGGACPNVSCLPSKNVIHSAKEYITYGEQPSLLQHQQNGVSANGIDMHVVKQRKIDMVDGLADTHNANFEKSGTEVIWGDGRFVGPKTIEVTDPNGQKRSLKADVVVLCLGSRALISDVPGLKEANPLTHVEMLDIDALPSHLIIVGAGYIGLEFAQAMKRFGSKVTVIDRNDRVLKREDEDVAAQLQQVLEKEGVRFATGTSIKSVKGISGEAVTLTVSKDGKSEEIEGSHILCATGRAPNTEDFGADVAGVRLNKHGHIVVDEWNRATEDGVFAVGDCTGPPYFTHIGYDDFRIVRDYLKGRNGPEKRRSTRQVPFTLFTDPEFAHIGLREHEAKAQNVEYRLTKLPMMAFLRTRTLRETTGFAKALISATDDTILGFTAVGAGVGELLPVVQLAMKKGLPCTDIADMVITHPTLSEGLLGLFMAVPPRSSK